MSEQIVNEVLESLSKVFAEDSWPGAAAALRGKGWHDLHSNLVAALAPIAERLAAESRGYAVMREAMEALARSSLCDWCEKHGSGNACRLWDECARWILNTITTLKPSAPATPAEPATPSLDAALAVVQGWAKKAKTWVRVNGDSDAIDVNSVCAAYSYSLADAVPLLKRMAAERRKAELAAAQARLDKARQELLEAGAAFESLKGAD